MTELSHRPARPRARTGRPHYPRALTLQALALAAACTGVVVAVQACGYDGGMIDSYTPSGGQGGDAGGGGEAGGVTGGGGQGGATGGAGGAGGAGDGGQSVGGADSGQGGAGGS